MQVVDEIETDNAMMRERRFAHVPVFVAVAILSVLLAVPVCAEDLVTLQLAQTASGAGEAAEVVKHTYGGQILSVSRQVIDGQVYFLVKTLLPGGRIKVVRVKADSGSDS